MYLSELAEEIRSHVPNSLVPSDRADELFIIYAVLVRAKGTAVTDSDIHDAWSAWMDQADPDHAALVPYFELDPEIAAQDSVFTAAVRKTARAHNATSVERTLFPNGVDRALSGDAIDLYKLMVSSSESLVSRRQGVNTFFMTVNGALLTALSLIGGSVVSVPLGAVGIGILAATGFLLSLAWRSLINSFGQLNTGKFRVINTMEKYLPAAIYAAEWEALERGENPKVYRSFTSREVWVPNVLLAIYGIVFLVSVIVACGLLELN